MSNLKAYLFLIIIIVLLAQCSPGTTSTKENDSIDEFISKVKEEFAPDKRVAIFNIVPEINKNSWSISGETNLPKALHKLEALLKENKIEFDANVKLLPAEDLGSSIFGIANLSVCNIRSKPSHSSELATQTTLGTLLKVYKKENNWYYVQTPDGYLGWLDSGGIQLVNLDSWTKWKESKRIVITSEFAFATEGASHESGAISDLVSGNILKLNEVNDGFYSVEFPDGRPAFVSINDAALWKDWSTSRSQDAARLIETAKKYMGRPYLWGGTSGKGVDCSGYTKTVFYHHGMILPRDASQQINVGMDIETDQELTGLNQGDLLFFGKKATEKNKEKITHVAIYMGDGKIIHSSGKVKIESLKKGDPDFNEYRLNTFVRAKRPLEKFNEYGIPLLSESDWY